METSSITRSIAAWPPTPQPPPLGPVRIDMVDGDGIDLFFPWELSNADYLRRVLAYVTSALQPVRTCSIRGGVANK